MSAARRCHPALAFIHFPCATDASDEEPIRRAEQDEGQWSCHGRCRHGTDESLGRERHDPCVLQGRFGAPCQQSGN
eukprot:2608922-Lingulodinium_polyedra.AAC.1